MTFAHLLIRQFIYDITRHLLYKHFYDSDGPIADIFGSEIFGRYFYGSEIVGRYFYGSEIVGR